MPFWLDALDCERLFSASLFARAAHQHHWWLYESARSVERVKVVDVLEFINVALLKRIHLSVAYIG
ncbi:hypothetical protein RCCGE510_20829 [Rhizobium sp. CCGE 510]|nr:hypothetical protein RCCGE510_20829 [Rhizobium sp. CCGE 510]